MAGMRTVKFDPKKAIDLPAFAEVRSPEAKPTRRPKPEKKPLDRQRDR